MLFKFFISKFIFMLFLAHAVSAVKFSLNNESGYNLALNEEEYTNVEFVSRRALLEHIESLKDLSFAEKLRAHPLSFLGECTKDDCGLNRLANEEPRNLAQQEIINQITTNFGSSRTLKIVSFASGGLLQDFFLLKELADRGFKNVEVKLIDTSWAGVLNSKLLNIETSLENLHELSSDQEHQALLARFVQFTAALPKEWKINFYVKAQELYFAQWPTNTADILWGIDFRDRAYCENTPIDFENLLFYVLKSEKKGIGFDLNYSCSNILQIYKRNFGNDFHVNAYLDKETLLISSVVCEDPSQRVRLYELLNKSCSLAIRDFFEVRTINFKNNER